MASRKEKQVQSVKPALVKTPTGITGLDEITQGGLPRGRPTLICGAAGSGKTFFGMEFLVRGALEFDEPGLFVSFEENQLELTQNFASLGFDLPDLQARKKVLVDHIRIERSEIEVTGEYDLEGLFIRMGHLIDSIGAKRVVLDTIEALFAGLPNELILRSELRRLFRWLKGKGVTAVITGERGEGTLTRHGLEEYVSDCVISIDHRVANQVATRRLRIVKYRGSVHGTNEYPFLLTSEGISVLPITSVELAHKVSSDRVPTGIARLDDMMGGKGYFKGSSILVSGTAGTGKSTLAAAFADSVCAHGGRVLYLAFEESPNQIARNMRSIGIDLDKWVKKGSLLFHASRPTLYGLEMHLATIHSLIRKFRPTAVIIDPISNLISSGDENEVKSMLTRLVDLLKMEQVTSLYTNLSHLESVENTDTAMSSLMDTWIVLRNLESGGERNRGLHVLKSRGMAHSNQIQEFLITSQGITLADAYLGQGMVLTGSARAAQEARDRAEVTRRTREFEAKTRLLERKRNSMEAQVAELRAAYDAEVDDLKRHLAQDAEDEKRLVEGRVEMGRLRNAAPQRQVRAGRTRRKH